jgi:IclR family KDG regulon transcriptional repressor
VGKLEMDQNYSIKSLHRAIQVLKSFSAERMSMSLTELHKLTKISKPALQRILTTLVYEGFLIKENNTKNYRIGLEVYFLGHLVQKDSSILTIGMPVLEKIRDKTGELVTLNTIYKNERFCIGDCQSKQQLTTVSFVGQRAPLYSGASGKILLAFLSESEIRDYLSEIKLEKITSNTVTDKEKIKEELIKIRKQGYAISYGERLKGVFGVSTPIFNPFNEVIAAISIVIPTARREEFTDEELIRIMKEGAQEITDLLGRREIPNR